MRNDRGTILVLVLWVLAFLTLVGGFYAVEARIRRNVGQQPLRSLQEREAARSVLVLVNSRLAAPNVSYEQAAEQGRFLTDGTRYSVMIGGREIEFALEDEQGKIDLNKGAEPQIRGLVRGVLGDGRAELADTIVDSILDWRDTDGLVRLNGAEDDEYEKKEPSYHPANGPFLLLNELLLVKGVSHELYYGPVGGKPSGREGAEPGAGAASAWKGGLQDLFTVYNGGGTVNGAYAPQPIKDIFGTVLSEKQGAHGVIRLKLWMGSRFMQLFFRPAGQTFKLLRWDV